MFRLLEIAEQGDAILVEQVDRMIDALNGLMLNVLAVVMRKDYENRRKCQAQGIEKAQQQGKYRGRQRDDKLRAKIYKLWTSGGI